MGNPMLNQLKQLPNNNNDLLSMLQNASNPQALIQNMISKNPQITNIINQYGGGNPKAAFYEYARRNGKDPNVVLDALKRFM